MDSIAQTVFEEMTSFYSIPENEEAFNKWKKAREERLKSEKIISIKLKEKGDAIWKE